MKDNKLEFFKEFFMYYCENSDFEIYTDLACERREVDVKCPEILFFQENFFCGKWERIEVTGELGARQLGRPAGYYDTMITDRLDLLDKTSVDLIKDELADEISAMMAKMRAKRDRILVVGLGNASLTPDSLGALTADSVTATMHIKKLDERTFTALGCSEIAVIKPGVGCQSGLDAASAVSGICKEIKPSAVIAIDALAARSPERLGTTVQLSSTGSAPGGGLGNARYAINEESVGAPVLSVGIPTVMDARYFIGDDVRREKHRSAMFISPKEIDEIVALGAEIIADGINRSLGIG